MPIEIREIFGDDLKILTPILKEKGWAIPHPALAMAKVAEENGKVVGFAIFQLIPHCDPLWVAPAYRGGDLTHQLARDVTTFARKVSDHFVCVATNGYVAILAEENGLKPYPGRVYVGEA